MNIYLKHGDIIIPEQFGVAHIFNCYRIIDNGYVDIFYSTQGTAYYFTPKLHYDSIRYDARYNQLEVNSWSQHVIIGRHLNIYRKLTKLKVLILNYHFECYTSKVQNMPAELQILTKIGVGYA